MGRITSVAMQTKGWYHSAKPIIWLGTLRIFSRMTCFFYDPTLVALVWLINKYFVFILQPQNISKTVTVKKHDEHSYEQNQYIFISHKTIQNEQFSRNDCIFFEVIVQKSRNS